MQATKKIFVLMILIISGMQAFSQQTGCVYGDCSDGYGKYVWESGTEYSGEWKNDLMHGEGTILFDSGSKYVGGFKDGKRHGTGTYTWSNKDRYTGHWQDNDQHGEGTYYYAGGDIKTGIWQNGKYQGKVGEISGCIFGDCSNGYGIYLWDNGEKYEGMWQNSRRNGQGTNYFADGERYEGEWQNDRRNGIGTNYYLDGSSKQGLWEDDKYIGSGKNNYGCISGTCDTGYGIYTWENGERYEGDWINKRRNGKGTNYYANGDKYTGEWKNDKKHGYGTYYYKSTGDSKSGMWKEDSFAGKKNTSGCIAGDCRNGFGTYITKNGSKYKGTFKDGIYHGEGTYAFSNGDSYTGEYQNGQRNGYGTYIFAETGNKYVGEWKNGSYHGIGTFYFANGKIQSGLWENGDYKGKKESTKPPKISWNNPQYVNNEQSERNIQIELCVQSESDIIETKIYVNNELKIKSPARGYGIVSSTCDYTIKKSLSLEPGKNEIVVEISNAGGSVKSDKRIVNYVRPDNTGDTKRIALVIGNANYQNSPLRNPANDAKAISAELRKLGFEVLEYTDLSQTDMKRKIREFGNKLSEEKGVGLFYFAGHGLQLNGENYIVPVDANIQKEQDVELEAVNLKRVTGEMDYAQNDMNIIILDACRNNPFVRSFRSGGNNGLATTVAPKGTFIAYATAPGSVAADGTGDNGLYTQELIKAISKPGLRIEDVFKQVRSEVYIKSGKQQVPWENSSIFGDFYFSK